MPTGKDRCLPSMMGFPDPTQPRLLSRHRDSQALSEVLRLVAAHLAQGLVMGDSYRRTALWVGVTRPPIYSIEATEATSTRIIVGACRFVPRSPSVDGYQIKTLEDVMPTPGPLGSGMPGHVSHESPGWVGPRLREARLRRGLSQADLARASGISESFIRLLERGRSDLSLKRLLSLCSAIGIAPADILRDAYSSVIYPARVADRIEVPRRETGNRLYLLFPAGESAFEPAIFELEPGVAMQQSMLHRGREFVFVLEGHVRLEVGSAICDIDAGDAADYQCSIPNRFSNLSDSEKASFLIVDAT